MSTPVPKPNPSHNAPARKLLPVPQRPIYPLTLLRISPLTVSPPFWWLCIEFTYAVIFILLSGLPTGLQITESLFQQVSRHYGLPDDIVSDRGPQFTSQVWRVFMETLGVMVSLTSGYKPKSNRQMESMNQELGRFLRSHSETNCTSSN